MGLLIRAYDKSQYIYACICVLLANDKNILTVSLGVTDEKELCSGGHLGYLLDRMLSTTSNLNNPVE